MTRFTFFEEITPMQSARMALSIAAAAAMHMAATAAEPRYIGGFNRPGPEPIVEPYPAGRGRRNGHNGGKRYAGGRYKGSTAAKRATRRGGNPAAQR